MSAAITFNELEWRSYSIMADASQTIVRVRQHSNQAIKHWSVLRSLSSMSGTFEDLLLKFHESDTILKLEAASPEDLNNLVGNVRQLHAKVDELVVQIRSIDKKLGYWGRLYRSRVQKVEQQNLRLGAEIDALSPTNSPLILLTKSDQHHLVNSLLQPSEPTDALRRAFARK